jgi:hypothetical protein
MIIVGVGSGRTAPSSLTQGMGGRTVSDVGKGRGGQGTGTGGGMTVSAVGKGGGGGRKVMGMGTGMGGMMVSSLSTGAGLGGQLARGKNNICAFAPGATTSKRVTVSKYRTVIMAGRDVRPNCAFASNERIAFSTFDVLVRGSR